MVWPALRQWVTGAALFVLLTTLAYAWLPLNYHWEHIFRPAALELLAGRTPYSVPLFFNPPWVLIPLLPFALLPAKLGSALMTTVTAFVYGFVAQRMGARPVLALLFVALPHNLYSLYNVNVEWLVALGFILPPRLGLFFVLAKPQAGATLALWWMVEAWRAGGAKAVWRLVWPVGLTVGAWLLLYGLPPAGRYVTAATAGLGLWPVGIPIGLALLAAAIRRRQSGLAIAAAPMLSPYSAIHVWPLALLGLLPTSLEFAAGLIGFWVLWVLAPQPDLTLFVRVSLFGQ